MKGHVTDHRLVPCDNNAPQPTEEEEERGQGCVSAWLWPNSFRRGGILALLGWVAVWSQNWEQSAAAGGLRVFAKIFKNVEEIGMGMSLGKIKPYYWSGGMTDSD